jgi:hypothetical protein
MFRAVTDIMEDIIGEDGKIIFKKDTVVEGYYADGYILGKCADVDDEYIAFESWVKVREETLEIRLGDIWVPFQGLCLTFDETGTFDLEDFSSEEIEKILKENEE